MTTSQTNQATEWSCYVPMWDDANDDFHNGWLTYRTDDPYSVHLEIEDWPAPVPTREARIDWDAVIANLMRT
ncbi:hypothetical protein [Nonomuraea sp. NEAU-A123]|uniref:hypothetical protein n=1 Tax=Nonomuraea sp. NEAU-A123 TaxID=2839649 RepID=UPI001BE46A14|nr:hypothetical protein [Nonomuraea sp. NEAU-A123]MBT2234721.1 hypothetical protein [Nonomuraea sp. NEAU-A123]